MRSITEPTQTKKVAPPCTDQGRAEPKSAELPLFYGADYKNYLLKVMLKSSSGVYHFCFLSFLKEYLS